MDLDDQRLRLSDHERLVLGTATGVVEQFLVQPVLFWKNSYQQGIRLTANPTIVYRGTFASCANMAALTGIQFISTGALQRLAGDPSGSDAGKRWGREVTCAFLGGAVTGPVCCMFELTMIQQQRFGGTFFGTIRRITNAHGPTGLFRGLLASTGREALFTAGYLGSLPATRTYLHSSEGFVMPTVSPVLAESVLTVTAGMACALISQPLDTAKTCMQGDLEGKRYGNTLATLRILRTEYGSVAALYRGYTFRCVLTIMDFILLDGLSRALTHIIFPRRGSL
mmetsp:Transcript_54307/g.151178  ORF Transcript_54307/g.151178 Transcript_54307/m.151178 type:complete len:282 (+) Transcript_54307:46-891(+)